MKVLLLGDKGYLGSYLKDNLDADTLKVKDRVIQFNHKKYDYVINCIGKPNLNYCEQNILDTDYSNWGVVKDINKHYPDTKIINFSSYYVYDSEGLCTESSNTTSKYAYCRQKLLSEDECTNGVTFRLGKLFGNVKAKQKKLTEFIIDSDSVTLDEVLFNPVSVDQVLTVIKYEINNNVFRGIYNLANAGVVSHADYGTYINELLGSDKKITRTSVLSHYFDNYGKFAMSLDKISMIIPLRNWRDDIQTYIKLLKKQIEVL